MINPESRTREWIEDRTKGPSCPKFSWRYSSAAVDWVDEDIKPKEGIDYHI